MYKQSQVSSRYYTLDPVHFVCTSHKSLYRPLKQSHYAHHGSPQMIVVVSFSSKLTFHPPRYHHAGTRHFPSDGVDRAESPYLRRSVRRVVLLTAPVSHDRHLPPPDHLSSPPHPLSS